MKKLIPFLALSLAANAAFLVTFFLRPADQTPTSEDNTAKSVPAVSRPSSERLSATLISAMTTGDLAQLKATNLPDDVARDLIRGRIYAQFQSRMKALSQGGDPTGPYWTNASSPFANQSRESRVAMMKIQREFSDALRALGEPNAFPGTGFDYLPAEKRDLLSRIQQDYSEMQSNIYMEMSGVQLPSDQEKLKLLREEQERDVVATLSPAELEQYLLHSSQTAQNIRGRYGDAIQTEDAYKRIFALQKAFDDQYMVNQPTNSGAFSKEAMNARRLAENKLQDDIRAAIGEENFTAFQRASDQEYKTLTSVAKRLNLPAGTADTIYTTRDTYAAQSLQINQNTALSPQDRSTQLKALAASANAALQNTLGAEGVQAYAQRANWLSILSSGNAFSTNPKDAPEGRPSLGTSVYPVQSPRPPAQPPKG